jgi:tricarballylate dehydrogenase
VGAGVGPVAVALDGVDLAIVGDVPVRVRQRGESMSVAPVADTLEALLSKLDVHDEERALRTIQEFNESTDGSGFNPYTLDGTATSGLDPEKSNWAVPLDEPPYQCFPVASAITFAFGGLKITNNARVVDRRGKSIEGLWAVGNSTAEFFYENYPGGSALTRGATFGRIAGENAATFTAAGKGD